MRIPAFYAFVRGVGLTDYWHNDNTCFIAQSIRLAERIPGHGDRTRCPYCVLHDVSVPPGQAPELAEPRP